MMSLQLISATSAYPLMQSQVVIICDLQRLVLYWFTRPDCNWTTKFRSQRISHMEPSATSTTVTGPVGERLQAGIKTSVLDRPGATDKAVARVFVRGDSPYPTLPLPTLPPPLSSSPFPSPSQGALPPLPAMGPGGAL